MRNFSAPRIWIAVAAISIFILAGSASLSAQGAQGSATDVQYHKFVPVVPPENSKFAATSSDPASVNATIGQQVQLFMQEKASRTPAQQKIDSNVLATIRMMRGQEAVPGVTSLYTGVDLDQKNRIAVDIVANVSDALLQQMISGGALILNSNKDYRAIRALVPSDQIETLAASPDVSFIGPKVGSITSRVKFTPPAHAATKGALAPGFDERAARVRKQIAAYLQQHAIPNVSGTPGVPQTGQGSVTSEGDATHQAAAARGVYGVSGVGLKIGVLSDSANSNNTVTNAQATGDLPPTCPGPGGPCFTNVADIAGGTDEGAAMLEIIYDMAPGASLFFATADISESDFAHEINVLQGDGCNIIVDDVFYFDEPVFQDGIVAQAVTAATNAGVMYFSSAGNEGNVAAGTGGYFEGDFNDAGSPAFAFPGGTKTGTIHNFGTVGTPINGDIITGPNLGERYTLSWADPQGTSANDYDLFLVSSAGVVKSQSTNIQSGSQNPFEAIVPPTLVAGDRLVVFKVSGAASVAFAIKTIRGTLTQVTTGETWGHSAIVGAFSVAATPAAAAGGPSANGPFPNPFTTANQAETYSSDGPRRMFFNPDGSAITPGNFLFGTNGGSVRVKPDITAADGVHTSLPAGELNPFYGTSAAAPAAASIAALVLSAKPSLTPAQIRTTLTSTALDIGPAGNDNVSGSGIVMALAALNSLGISGFSDVELGTITASENPGNGNGVIEAGEGAKIVIQLKNLNGVMDATNISAVLTTTTPGVTITQPATSAYANLAAGSGVGNNLTPFTFTLASNMICGPTLNFTLTLTYNNGPAPTKALNFSVPLGVTVTIVNNLGGATPSITPSAGITFATGTQTDRINRAGGVSACGTQKSNPGIIGTGGTRVFDSYTFTNATTAAVCLNPVMNSSNGINLETVAYNAAGFVPSNPSTNYAADQGTSSATETFGVSVPVGAAATLVVSDVNVVSGGVGSGSTYSIQFPACILLNNATINHPPIAVAQNVTVTAATIGGTAAANINNGSSDPDAGDTITLSQNPAGPYPVGVTSVILTVTDSKGAMAQATANVTVVNPPTITSLSPSTTVAGSGAFALTVTGTNFVNGSVVNFNGAAKATSFQNSTQLTASILSADVTTAGTPAVTVTNPGAVTSAGTAFTVTNTNNPAPLLNSISPTIANAGSAAFTLTVTGSSFVPNSVVNWNGSPRVTTFVSATQLMAAITAADIQSVGSIPVSVTNPAPGGGTSSSVFFTIQAPTPTIATLVPNSAAAGGAAFTLLVNGTNFLSTSTVNWNGGVRVTTFVNSTQLSAAITAADILSVGSASVTVVTPNVLFGAPQQLSGLPSTVTSNTVTFTITATNPAPTITTLVPNSTNAGGAGFNLIVNGTGFVSTSVVNFNGSPRVTTLNSASQVTAAILAGDIATQGTALITVTNPAPGGGTSTAATFTVNNPFPTVTSISPTTGLAGGAAFTLTVNGTGFVSTSVVNFNHIARTTTFVNSTQVTAAILATDIAASGTDLVTVTNPPLGGGTSTNAVNFQVNNPVPTITTLSPTGTAAGSTAFTLTINGTNFVTGATVSFGGVTRAATVTSSTQLTTQIIPVDVATVGTPAVIVTNPTPGGGASNSVNFNVTAANNPVPTVTTLLPATAAAGSAAFTLTVNGTNFVANSVVNFGGAARATTFVSATQLTAAILAGDVAAAGTPSVTVTNPTPGGGTSNGVTFTITATQNPVPALISLAPNTASAGSGAFILTVNGTNFVNGAVVSFNGQNRVTTFVSSTQVTAAILAADISTVNFFAVTVTNPAPGGGPSPTSLQFIVTTPVPAITALVPNTAIAGGAAFTLTVNGSNFISSSTVQWNGGNRTTTFVNATQLTAAVTAADIAAVGSASVKVFTPTVILSGRPQGAPAGTTSNTLTFAITAANPVPTLTSIAPATVSSGGAAFTLTLTGTNFISSSVANIKGSPRVTTFVSATQLTAAITAADIAAGGTAAITVVTPTPGGGTTSAVNLTITDFSVTSPNPTQTVTAGQTANFTITTAPVGGTFTGNVTFTTSALPQGAVASFNPTSVASGSSTTMSISTTARGSALVTRPPFNPNGPLPNTQTRPWWLVAFLLTLALTSLTIVKFGRRNVKRLIPIGAFALLLISAGYLSGCAGSGFPKIGSPTGTPAGTYPVTVTGTSGTVQHTTTVTLIVQ